jgi:hypothetical protein
MLCMPTVVRNETKEPRPQASYPVGSIGWLRQQEARESRQKFRPRY